MNLESSRDHRERKIIQVSIKNIILETSRFNFDRSGDSMFFFSNELKETLIKLRPGRGAKQDLQTPLIHSQSLEF